MDHRRGPSSETSSQETVLLQQYTLCSKNHTHHSEIWPSSGEIVVEKCERQCRFRGCKAWSQTAAALRKHVNKHIQHNSLPLKIVSALSGRAPLKIVAVQDYGNTSYNGLDSLANAPVQDSYPLQPTSGIMRPLSPFPAFDPSDRIVRRDETDKQHVNLGTSSITHDEQMQEFQVFGSGLMTLSHNNAVYDTIRSSLHSPIDESHAFGSIGPASKEVPAESSSRDHWATSIVAHSLSSPRDFDCSDRRFVSKTRFEQRKHNVWHNKKLHCYQPGSNRKIDLSNELRDLRRHMKLMHPPAPTTKYRCSVSECKSKKKGCLGEDEFINHLFQSHPKDVVEDIYGACLDRCRVAGDDDTMPGNGVDLRLHVLADSAAFAR